MRGRVKWFNNKKGYGFITNENEQDIFIHYSGIDSEKKFKKLDTDDEVIFDVETDEHGLEKAINVQLVEKKSVKVKNKAYIVYESWNTCDDSSPIAVFLDEKKCDEFINRKNRAWKEDDRRQDECTKCRGCDKDNYGDSKENTFRLKDVCGRASIGTDRYGMYCENDAHEYHSRSSNYYSKDEVELFK